MCCWIIDAASEVGGREKEAHTVSETHTYVVLLGKYSNKNKLANALSWNMLSLG